MFFNRPTASADSSASEPGYVGSFSILGHGGCFGEDVLKSGQVSPHTYE